MDTCNPLTILHERNLGFSTRREPYENGVAVLVVEVMLHQGDWEGQLQGEGRQDGFTKVTEGCKAVECISPCLLPR